MKFETPLKYMPIYPSCKPRNWGWGYPFPVVAVISTIIAVHTTLRIQRVGAPVTWNVETVAALAMVILYVRETSFG